MVAQCSDYYLPLRSGLKPAAARAGPAGGAVFFPPDHAAVLQALARAGARAQAEEVDRAHHAGLAELVPPVRAG